MRLGPICKTKRILDRELIRGDGLKYAYKIRCQIVVVSVYRRDNRAMMAKEKEYLRYCLYAVWSGDVENCQGLREGSIALQQSITGYWFLKPGFHIIVRIVPVVSKNVQTIGTIIWKRYPDDRKRLGRFKIYTIAPIVRIELNSIQAIEVVSVVRVVCDRLGSVST